MIVEIYIRITWLTSLSDRVPLDERLRERDLEAAIVLSLLNSENGMNDQSFQGASVILKYRYKITIVYFYTLLYYYIIFLQE